MTGVAATLISAAKIKPKFNLIGTIPIVENMPSGRATRPGDIIRSYGGYPDAVAFAVLLMNMAAPTIDYYTQPRVFGQREDADG